MTKSKFKLQAKPLPRASALLDDAHKTYEELLGQRHICTLRGLAMDELPDEVTLMAFALLGERDRGTLIKQLAPEWLDLCSKGLARGQIEGSTTPAIRLLIHALPLTVDLPGIVERLTDTDALAAPAGLVRCVNAIHGAWGQVATIHFEALDCDYLAINLDSVFGRQNALLAGSALPGPLKGSFSFPVDKGNVQLRLLQRTTGTVYSHDIAVTTSEEAWS